MKQRLPFLDTVRGLLALIVVLNHLLLFVDPGGIESGTLDILGFRVPMFFTLSGFVLYYSAADRERVESALPFWEIVRRRARRLLPGYYAGLLLGLLFLAALTYMEKAKPGSVLPIGLSLPTIIQHLLLLQSWSPDIFYSINAPCWMMGYEWQLSLCLPMFLWIAGRIGWCGLISLALLLQFPAVNSLQHGVLSPVYTLCFILGAAAARIVRRPEPLQVFGRDEFREIALAVMTLAGCITVIAELARIPLLLPVECFSGVFLAAFCIYVCLTPNGMLATALNRSVVRHVGKISYSLFLVHFPIFNLTAILAGHWHLQNRGGLWLLYLASMAISMGLAVVFYRCFEAPFMRRAPEPSAKRPPQASKPNASVRPSVASIEPALK